ncbi:DUF1552 domain-containing protein [Rhodopirellula europaea]|jgi:hypothetical protein|uniref:Secreted protein containing DUF1552 n=1 Tax=Rhodopirellula europaea SH398 TaxID=1263868 RepID=M5S512_9BACT|nr:DUF1552 domain-containing protein [Rhodopirellula europaea]EMI26551.1 secreted protein containing DUF1552 [Rhodopirellula europaea SH398]
MQKPIPRRRFLRGSGAVLGLPWMASMADTMAAAKPDASGSQNGDPQPPLRTAFLYFPNGVWEKDWVPQSEGADYELSPSLEPLADLKDDFLVLSGLDKKHSHGGDGHYAKTANYLTGMPVAKTTGKDISSGGISIDQLIAAKVGNQTPLPSLELGIDPVISGIDSNVGYTRLYGSHISWQSPTRPIAKAINPRVVYERLFGKRMKTSTPEAKSYQNLLDYVLEDARQVRGKLSRDDQFKMDEYLDSVREVEKRIEFATRDQSHRERYEAERDRIASGHALEIPETGTPGDFRQHIDLMLDMMVLAFQTDSTRVASFMFANDVSGRSFSFLDGVHGGHHELSHHENKEEKIAQYQLINRWHTEQFARMLRKMKAVKEGESTLLDNSMIMFGSSFSDGNRHDPDNLPLLLAGRGGGTIQPGRHIAAKGQVPVCNLYLSMAKRYGLDLERFGDSEAELTELADA